MMIIGQGHDIFKTQIRSLQDLAQSQAFRGFSSSASRREVGGTSIARANDRFRPTRQGRSYAGCRGDHASAGDVERFPTHPPAGCHKAEVLPAREGNVRIFPLTIVGIEWTAFSGRFVGSVPTSSLELRMMGSSPGGGLRVSLRDLMVWTVGCALGFAAYRWIMPPWPMPPRTRGLSWAYNLLMGGALGTLVAGATTLAYRRSRGDRSYPSQPGHWLLLFGIAAALADGVAIVVDRGLVAAWYSSDTYRASYWLLYRLALNGPDLPGMIHQCVGWGLGTVIALAFLWGLRRRLNWAWLAVFLAFFLSAGVLSAGAIETTFSAYGTAAWFGPHAWYRQAIHLYAGFLLLGAASIVLAIVRDRLAGTPADGLHWAGVLAWLTIALTQGTLYVGLMLMR